MGIYCKNLHTKGPRLVGGGGEETPNCDWIDLKFRGSFLSLRRSSGGNGNIPKNTWREPDRGQEPIEKKTKK